MKSVKVAVVGAGVVGLSTAVCVAETLPECSVTVLAEKFSPDTTSDGAAGILLPMEFPDISIKRQHEWFKNTFDHLLAIAFSSQASEAGVFLISGYQVFKDLPSEKTPFWADVVLGFRLLAAGGQVLQAKVSDLQELALDFNAIFNCSGLGSLSLLPDQCVYPVRGQIMHLHAPWLKHFTRDGDGSTYIYPGVSSVTAGGTRQQGDWRLELDNQDAEGILERCRRLEPSLKSARVTGHWVGLRPARETLRLERDELKIQGRVVPLVHNYGHGGCGVSVSWGTALNASGLLHAALGEKMLHARL
ncbi:hypothetical protein DNTS_016242 [Danionella cerebrum]|uniref:D-aspartate oxidase n=1 Tax=Danionella cerebrum TaxID=2873325 RepID=A0A553Q0R3_9TELE|nr:hypothetical protein DNTS_016242 [Danionella translucida]